MSIISDKMKNHINTINDIKIKLMKNDIWSADNLSNSLKSHKDIDHIDISESKDKLFIHMKPSYKIMTNCIDLNSYSEISSCTKKLINPKSNYIKQTLNDIELGCIKELGVEKASNMMYHIYSIPQNNMIIMDL